MLLESGTDRRAAGTEQGVAMRLAIIGPADTSDQRQDFAQGRAVRVGRRGSDGPCRDGHDRAVLERLQELPRGRDARRVSREPPNRLDEATVPRQNGQQQRPGSGFERVPDIIQCQRYPRALRVDQDPKSPGKCSGHRHRGR